MKTILYTISTLQRSGPSLVLLGLIKNLDRNNFKPIIMTLSEEKEITLKSDLEKLNIDFYCLKKRGIFTFLIGSFKFRKLINKINPDIIHVNGFRDILLTAFFAPRKYKKFATIHCDWEVDYKLKYGCFIGWISGKLQSLALKFISVKIACSKMLADLLNKKYLNMHFDFVNNGVDVEKFCPTKDKMALRKKLGLSLDRKIVIWAGSFISRKDPLLMARAILQMSEDKYYFVFCGARGPLLEECKELLKQRKDVLFTGYITNIEEYYKASDIYVSTSLSEGLPLAVLETEFCGLVPLLSDIPQHRYILPKKILRYCLYNCEKALFKKLICLLTADTTELASVITENMDAFSTKNMSKKYQRLYDTME